jgi:Spy/CpxP family protein refolding chaperone
MSEQDSTHAAPNTTQNSRPRSRRGWIVAGSVVGVLALLAGAKALVYAQGGGWHHGRGGPMNAQFVADRIEHGVKYVLSDVDATAEQKAQATAILQSAASDVRALADQHLSARKQLHEILAADTIDRARLESVRADQLRLADQASKRILQGIADAAEVLTPQQRAALAAKAEQRGHWRDGGH